eukprot:symbB.v1.2.030771.t1/scaffold3505.1/size55173/3
MAAAAFRANRFEEAEGLYTEALEAAESGQQKAAALNSRAQCRLKLKNFEGAREDASTARALEPENPKAWYRLGSALSALGRLAEAQEAYEEAQRQRPEDSDVRSALLSVLRRRNEREGRYDWLQVYQKYFETGPLAVAAAKGKSKCNERSQESEETEGNFQERLIATLEVEPYVGPVRLGYSEERGRGLFVTEDVPKGRLLLCAKALVTGLNEDLPKLLRQQCVGGLLDLVRSLSRGTPESERKMPATSVVQLADPQDLLETDESADELTLEEARDILYHNQFSLPLVNPNAAPLEVGNDTERSGLWLLPVFVNHSCLPNVQRIIVLDCLFLRAGRDLKCGDELFDSYVETLQPFWHRRDSLVRNLRESLGHHGHGDDLRAMVFTALANDASSKKLSTVGTRKTWRSCLTRRLTL